MIIINHATRGVPGRDYPIHNSATDSSFSCKGRVPGAYYADPSLDCQVVVMVMMVMVMVMVLTMAGQVTPVVGWEGSQL